MELEWNGMEWNGMEWNSATTEHDGIVCDVM